MALEGSLADMSLSDLIQIFHLSTKSGILRLFNKQQRGIIYVDQGNLVHALVICRSSLKLIAANDEAVLEMMNWDETTAFIFQHNTTTYRLGKRITRESAWLIREGLRQRSTSVTRPTYQTITLDTPLQLAMMPMNSEHGTSLGREDWRIMSHLSHQKTLRHVCALTDIDPARAVCVANELVSIGLIEVVPPCLVVPAHERATQAAAVHALSQLPNRAADDRDEVSSQEVLAHPSSTDFSGKALLQ